MFGLRKKSLHWLQLKINIFTLEDEYNKRIGGTGKVLVPSGMAPTGTFFWKDIIGQQSSIKARDSCPISNWNKQSETILSPLSPDLCSDLGALLWA